MERHETLKISSIFRVFVTQTGEMHRRPTCEIIFE
jgi:hypothetical protein